ncbi:cytosol aminopeptidase-like [Macrosteles quadrilineatus]|uniref:cytosol aminopeptidase-like n=1 Tax=Macrosteles quadrilineatus TaxID=74068 RepID=UPI0023E0BDA6|nr:cytosol aminopeptidase-like [Macrosteles quadrilineatus]
MRAVNVVRSILRRVEISSFSTRHQTRNRGLVVGAYENPDGEECTELSPLGQKIDDQSGGKIRNALNGLPAGIGKLGRVVTLTDLTSEFPQIAVAGLGPKDADFNQVEYLDEGKEFVRIATGLGARELQKMGVTDIGVEGFNKADAAAEGATLGVWYYTNKEVETKVSLQEGGDGEDWERGVTKADAQNIVRCLCETPPNYLTPRIFTIRARDLLCPYGVQVHARDIRWMKIHHFTSLLQLGASSVEPPMFLELNYCSDPIPTTKPYMFFANGTTFNSGGLCVQECRDMMRAEIAAAAVILGVFKAVASMRLPINMRAFIPLYENMLSGTAMKSGDALRVKDSILRTENTQNHSQILLAEAMSWAVPYYPPELVFTLGTLSKNIKDTVGFTSSVWARNDYVWDHVNYAGAVTGDRMWRYPLFLDYANKLRERTDVDVNNLGIGRTGEPNLIAAFLNYFVEPSIDFTYIDVTGSSDIANGYVHYLAADLYTGSPTRGIIQLLCHLNYCKEQVRAAAKKEYKSEAEN